MPSYIAGGAVTWCSCCGTLWRFLKKAPSNCTSRCTCRGIRSRYSDKNLHLNVTALLFTIVKGGNITDVPPQVNTSRGMCEPGKPCAVGRKAVTEDQLYDEMSGTDKAVKTDSRSAVAQDWGYGWGMGV